MISTWNPQRTSSHRVDAPGLVSQFLHFSDRFTPASPAAFPIPADEADLPEPVIQLLRREETAEPLRYVAPQREDIGASNVQTLADCIVFMQLSC